MPTTPQPSLLERFKAFMTSYPSAEAIDDLVPTGSGSDGVKRADYLLGARTAILELKSLETDLRPKLDSISEVLARRADWPLFYGSAQLSKVVDRMPDKDTIIRDVFVKMSRSVENAFKSADDQVRDTRGLFGLPIDTPGLLVLLNEDIEDLGPEIMVHRVKQLLGQQRADGRRRYVNISVVTIICEAHVLTTDLPMAFNPVITIEGPLAAEHPQLVAIAHELVQKWAASNRMPLIHTDPDKVLSGLQRKSSWDLDHAGTLTRQQLWEREYRDNPYLRGLSDEAVLEHGRRLAETMAPHFLVGGEQLPEPAIRELLAGWTHFLVETRHRGLDLRGMGTF